MESPASVVVPAGPLPLFDLEVIPFDSGGLRAWTEQQLDDLGLGGPLETLHARASSSAARDLVHLLTERSAVPEVRSILSDVLPRALRRLPWAALRIQAVLQFRIHLPHDAVSPGPPHTDYGVGHSLVERNLWVPLTDVQGSTALHALELAPSLSLDADRRARGHRYLDEPAAELRARPMKLGQALLFTPLHVHAARPNRSATTRVSFDLRFLPAAYADGYRWVSL